MGASRAVLELQEVTAQSDDTAWLYNTVKRLVARARKEDFLGKTAKSSSRFARDKARRKLHEAYTTFQCTRVQSKKHELPRLKQALKEASDAIPQPTTLRGARTQVLEVEELERVNAWPSTLERGSEEEMLRNAAAKLWQWRYHPEIARDVCKKLLKWVAPTGIAPDPRMRDKERRIRESRRQLGQEVEEEEDAEERLEELRRVLQDAGVPGTLWHLIGQFGDDAEVPVIAVPLLSVLSIELTVRMMEMQIDQYLPLQPHPTRAFVCGLRCLTKMGQDEDLRREIVEHEGRKLLDFTLQTAWARNPASKLELEGARRRLLVESMRVSKAAEAEEDEAESEVNIEDLYTQEQLDDMRVAFETFDLDGSGDIDSDELGLVMKKLGLNPTEAEIEDMIRAADNGEGEGGGDGKIDWQEFLALMARGMGKDNEDEYQRAYNFFDQDNKGYIDVIEFIEKLRQLTSDFSDEEVDLMIFNAKFEDELFDRLTYKEFVKLMMAE